MSRGLGKVQREALAIIQQHPGIRTSDIAWRMYGQPVSPFVVGRTDDKPSDEHRRGRDLDNPSMLRMSGSQASVVRRAVRGLRRRGLVTVKEFGHPPRTWHELWAVEQGDLRP